MSAAAFPMMVPQDGNDLARDVEGRDRAPVVGTYICDPICYRQGVGPSDWHGDQCWHESARRRLAWQYGEARANRIALGIDARTNADIAAWNRVGGRS